MSEFEPAVHRMVPEQRWFGDFLIGEWFMRGVVLGVPVGERRQPSGALQHRILPCAWTAVDAGARRPDADPDRAGRGGCSPPSPRTHWLGFLEQSSRFLKPVYAGDTLYPTLEVDELSPNRSTGVVALRSTVHNQRKEPVLEGRQRFLLRKRSE